jgi:transposase InsO family protein
MRLSPCPEEEPEMRIGDYLRTKGKLLNGNAGPENIEVSLDTCAEVDVIDIEFAKQRGLKPYFKKYPQLLQMAGAMKQKARGAFWATWEMTDHRGVVRSHKRPFLAIQQGPEDASLLLGERTLKEIGMMISLKTDEKGGNQWCYDLDTDDKPLVKAESARKFLKRLKNNPRVYALVARHIPEGESGKNGQDHLPAQLLGYKDVFSAKNSATLAPNREGIDLAIDIQEGKEPPYGPLYPLSQAELEVLRKYLQENLEKGFIRLSKSPAGSPILFVPKKDGTLRLCVDYRGLNSITVKNRYPLPLIGEILDRVNGATVFSKIDLKDAYYRIRIKPGDEWKTAFRTRYGHFEYLVMPFGLTNAPAAFQAYINHALRGLVDDFCIVYLDDILIFSRSQEEHTEHLRQVCDRLRESELYANPSKCQFYQEEMGFLGFVINPEGVRMDWNRVKTITEWKDNAPKSFRDVQVLLGFCNFYRRFIQGYSRLAQPLTSLMKGSKNGKKTGDFKKEWGKAQQESFIDLLSAFEKAPLLRHFDPDKPIRVETDASKWAAGGILSQRFEGRWHPIAFYSRQFKGPELNYGTPDQEMLAIVEAFKHWRHYLEGSRYPVEVLTDHQNLQGFMKQPRLNGRQARWCYYLTPYDFVIKWRSGSTNPADAPSRRPDYMVPAGDEVFEDPSSGLLATLGAKVARVQQMTVPRRQKVLQYQDEGRKLPWRPDEGTGSPLDVGQTWQQKEAPQRTGQDLSLNGVERIPHRSRVLRTQDGNQKSPQRTCLNGSLNGAPQEEGVEADHLLRLVKVQYLTRERARAAVQSETPMQEPSTGLRELVAAAQKEDTFCRRLVEDLKRDPSTRQSYRCTSDGLLLYKGKRLVVPNQRSLVHELLRLHHDAETAGHWGVQKTLELLQRKFKWEGMRQDVEEYVLTCPVCQRNAAPRHKPYGKLQPLPQPSRPWKEISMDLITQLPISLRRTEEYDAILTIVDRYTKMAVFLPVTNDIGAADLAEVLHTEVELRFGAPSGIVSDRDSRITSKFWAEICYHSLIKRRLSTAFHPQTDGQTEILNRIVETYLRAFTNLEQMNWAKLLPTAAFAYNNSLNHTLRMSPFRAMYGYDPEFHVDVADDVPKGEIPAAKDRIKKLHELRATLRDQVLRAQERQIRYYNERHTPAEFKRGSLVKLSTRNLKMKDKKLQPRFIGPFRVTEVIGTQAYRLALPEQYSRLHDVFPVQVLEKYHPRDGDDELPLPDLEDEPDEYEVEEIRDKRMIKGKVHYLVKWTGWPSEYNQWVPDEHMNAQGMINSFEKSRRGKRRRKEQDRQESKAPEGSSKRTRR